MNFRLAQVAAHHHRALDTATVHLRALLHLDLFRAFLAIAHPLLALEDFIAGLDDALFDVLIAGRTNQAEFQESRSLNGGLGALLVGGRQTGQLDQNTVIPLRLDERLGHAKLINALAQHLHGMGKGGAGIGGFGQAVGVHFHEERRAALQVETQADAAGGCALQAVQDVGRRVQLVLRSEGREIAGDVVGADGLHQILIGFLRRGLLQGLGLLENGAKSGVPAHRLLAEEHQ